MLHSGTQNPINIISKPFYKNHIINSAASALHKALHAAESGNKSLSSSAVEDIVDDNDSKLKNEKPEPKKTVKNGKEKAKNRPLVLMVEDNKTNQMLQRKLLQKLNFAVDIAQNGLEGLNKVKEKTEKGETYHFILMDFHMPVMDGKKSTEEIRRFELENNISPTHIIGLTANPSEGAAVGMCTIISKPVMNDTFSKLIDSVLAAPCDCYINQKETCKQNKVI